MPLLKKCLLALPWTAGLPTQLWCYDQRRCRGDLAFPSALWVAFAPQSLPGTHPVAAHSSSLGAACFLMGAQARLVPPLHQPFTAAHATGSDLLFWYLLSPRGLSATGIQTALLPFTRQRWDSCRDWPHGSVL